MDRRLAPRAARSPCIALVLLLSACLCACSSSGSVTDAAALTAALSGAREGDVVRVAAGRFEGRFTVPAGVTLEGAGASTVIAGARDLGALAVRPGDATPTTVRALRVELDGGWGIASRGAGSVVIEDVTLAATRGAGIGAEDLSSLRMTRVALEGPADTEEEVSALPTPYDASTTATHGLVLLGVSDAVLEDVTVTGFATMGAGLVESSTAWTRGGAPRNVLVGLAVVGGDAMLSELSLDGTLGGFTLQPAYGAYFADAEIATRATSVMGSQGFGLISVRGRATHDELSIQGTATVALLAQDADELVVTGSTIEGASAAGIAARGVASLRVEGSMIAGTTEVRTVIGAWETPTIGDGLEISAVTAATLRELMVVGNERAAIVVDLGGATTSGLGLDGVTVDGAGDGLGCVVQNGTRLDGWETGLTRLGATMANDAAFFMAADTLDLVGVIAPVDTPQTSALSGEGLAGVIAPVD